MERTLIIFKPDSVKRGIVGEVLSRFEKAGLKIVGMKMTKPDEKHFHEHYEGISQIISRWGEEVYKNNTVAMMSGPVVAVVLEGVEAIQHVRKMVGKTDPKEALPGTIRGDYTHLTKDFANGRGGTLPNIMHASGDAKEAAQEIELWFDKSELFDYQNVHETVVHGQIVE